MREPYGLKLDLLHNYHTLYGIEQTNKIKICTGLAHILWLGHV
jgi:hypothetical protein